MCARAPRGGAGRGGATRHIRLPESFASVSALERRATPRHRAERERDGLTRGAAGDGRVEIRARAHVHAGMRVLGRSRAAAATADVDVDVDVVVVALVVFIVAIVRIVSVVGVDELEPGVDRDAVCGAPGEQGSDAR